MKKVTITIALILVILFSVSCTQTVNTPTTAPTNTTPSTAKPVVWRIGTAAEGSPSYALGMAIAKVVQDNIQGVKFVLTPVASSQAMPYMYENNELDWVLLDTFQAQNLLTSTGPYAQKPIKYTPYSGLCFQTYNGFIVTKAGRKDITSWADLKGKKLYSYTQGSQGWYQIKTALTTLGYWDQIQMVDMDRNGAAEALDRGLIDATYYMLSTGVPAGGWAEQIQAQVDIKVVNPSPAEVKVLQTLKIYPLVDVSPSGFRQPVGVEKIITLQLLNGFHPGPAESEDSVYKVVKVVLEHPTAMKTLFSGIDDGFVNDPVGWTAAYQDAIPGMPIHPGIAKYLKEKGKWNDAWVVGKLFQRP